MNSPPINKEKLPAEPIDPVAAGDEATGLPLLRNWRAVYLFVLGCFVAYVVVLLLFKWAFSS